ncbi:MAG: RtcB family protein [Candidatus Methanomethylophilaceae archaeon]|nr:RtcB family protein [Candidatus Methanomethylophilaceae archaeon]
MTWEGRLCKIDENRWEIPMDGSAGMRTNAIIYASEDMIKQVCSDNAPQQAANVACLPGIVGSSMAMPDIHWGYGFPIGGVAAVDGNSGCISPGGIGFDINCGVRLIKTDLTLDDIGDKKDALVDELYRNVPSGLGSKGLTHVGLKELNEILERGSEWAVENGYGWEDDLDATEEHGRMTDADASLVGEKALKRGLPQLGSLGSGNHFLELDVVENVFDDDVAKAYGLKEGTLTVTVHCGSRGCGHQIATDYLQEMERYIKRNSVSLPDRQLACAPLDSKLGDDYYKAMCCGANYAWANRQMITHWARESFEKVLGDSAESMGMKVVYDVAHNIAKKERHDIDRHHEDVLVHRKGATRAFAPGRSEIPLRYRDVGQPVIIPGDMSVGTYVLAGRKGSMEQTFGSSCHGAGRKMSRKEAVRSLAVEDVRRRMSENGIYLRDGSDEGVLEEAPDAYKDVDEVVEVVCRAGLTAKVAKLTPIGVIKGRAPSLPRLPELVAHVMYGLDGLAGLFGA